MIEKLDQLTKTASVILLFFHKRDSGQEAVGLPVRCLQLRCLFITFLFQRSLYGQSYCRYKRNYSAIRSQTAVEKATGSSIGSPSMRSAWL